MQVGIDTRLNNFFVSVKFTFSREEFFLGVIDCGNIDLHVAASIEGADPRRLEWNFSAAAHVPEEFAADIFIDEADKPVGRVRSDAFKNCIGPANFQFTFVRGDEQKPEPQEVVLNMIPAFFCCVRVRVPLPEHGVQ